MFVISKKIRKIVAIILASLLVLLIYLFFQLNDWRFHIYFFDVGQGDSILIKTPENHQILIDGGSGNSVLRGLASVMPFFDKSLDMVVLTHPHADHVQGLVEVLKKYDVGEILITGVTFEDSNYEEFLDVILEKKIPVFLANSEDDFLFGDVFFDVLYPFKQMPFEEVKNLNNSSVVIKVSHKNHLILLTGDLEKDKEAELLKSGYDLKSYILKAGHHGSKSASSPEFLNEVEPEIVVISCGKNNSYGHPHEEALKNFSDVNVEKIYRTDMDGMVEFVFE